MIQRIKKRVDFLTVRQKGTHFYASAFIIQCMVKTEASSCLRVGFTASKKVGNAVMRNLSKRRLRSLVDGCLKDYFSEDKAFDFVFIANKSLSCMDFSLLQEELKKGLSILSKKCLK